MNGRADAGNETIGRTRPEVMRGMNTRSAYDLDLRDVRGQFGARRALEIAAAGGHHLLMVGPAGCGKTMLATRLPGLLPGPDAQTPCLFRAPHHTASAGAMLGAGGEPARPGEVSMADGGILFLDELPEVSGTILQALREPLERGTVTLRRASDATTLPARFLLVAAMNPCPCGEWDEARGVQRCTAEQVARYHARVARTVGEHLHLVVTMRREPIDADRAEGEASAPVRARIARAREAQAQRQDGLNYAVAGDVLRERAMGSEGAERLLDTARKKRGFSECRTETVLRVARTIADLALAERVEAEHVAEALGFQRVELDASCAGPS